MVMAASGKLHSKVKMKKNLGDHDPEQCNHRLNAVYIHEKKTRAVDGKDKIQIVNNDIIREAIVPNREPLDLPGIWQRSEFKRLQDQAHVVTLEDKKAMLEEAERKRNEEMYGSEMRKAALAKAHIRQEPKIGSKLNNVENDAKDKSEYLLQRSKELINEQDDRVKVANGLILATKCRAIRNAQIIEKEIIRKQLHQESRRLDDMMEQERQRCLAEDERKAEQEDHRNKRHGKEIKQQIKDNEVEKLLEAERKEEECRMINKALIAMRKEEQEKVKQHKASQEKVRKELHQANLDMERYKLIQKEEQRISDLRVQEFMRQKAAREEAREAELALAKSQKEKEISRLRQQQENAQDKQAIEDEMNAIRIQEEVERAWRDKEMKAAIKKISDMKALNEARALQIENTRKAQAISIARDEVNFHKVARVQYELFQKDTEKKAQKKARNNKHRQDILKQINEKERQRINQVKEKFEDGKVFRLNQAIRDNQIEGYIKQKINKLRQEPISPNYVKDIERQLQITDS